MTDRWCLYARKDSVIISIETGAAILVTTATSIYAIYFLVRRRSSLIAWYTLLSVLFVNLAAIIGAVSRPSPASQTALFVVTTGLLAVLFGYTFMLLLQSSASASTRNIPHKSRGVRFLRSYYLVAVAILAPAWLYFALLGYVPLVEAARAYAQGGLDSLGTLHQTRLARDGYARASGQYIPMQGLLELFRNFGSAIVFVAGDALRRSGARSRGVTFWMLASVVTCLAAGQRWPLMYLLLAVLLARAKEPDGLPWRRMFGLATVAISAGATLSAFQARTDRELQSIGDAFMFGLGDLLDRIVINQTLIPLQSYEMTEKIRAQMQEPSYWTSIKTFAPGEGESFPIMFYNWVSGDAQGFTAPPDFYTEAYINGGLALVVAGSFLWGMFLATAETWTPRNPNPISVGSTALVSAVLALSASTGAMFSAGAFVVVLYAGLVYFIADMLEPRVGREAVVPPRLAHGSP